MTRRMSLDEAWAEAEAALPEGAWLDGVIRHGWDPKAPFIANAVSRVPGWADGPGYTDLLAEGRGPTPAAALHALAERLRGREGRE